MPINYHCEECDYRLDGRRQIDTMLRRCIEAEGRKCTQINIVFCPDAHLLEINRKYLNHDYLTDIITFDYGLEDYRPLDGADPRAQTAPTPHVCGDLYISIDTVADNARKYGVPAHEEMRRVILHGVLHLCGYGDATPEQQAVMRAREDHYLAAANNP